MTNLKLTMQIGASQFAAEGPEAFIVSMFEKWKELNSQTPYTRVHEIGKDAKNGQASVGVNELSGKYENVFDEVDGALKIIANMPGANKATKTRSTALALLFGHLLRGESTTSAETIREACVDQGCYDSSNFARQLIGCKEKVVRNTKAGGGYDVKLTAPGRKAAQELVEQLNNGIA